MTAAVQRISRYFYRGIRSVIRIHNYYPHPFLQQSHICVQPIYFSQNCLFCGTIVHIEKMDPSSSCNDELESFTRTFDEVVEYLTDQFTLNHDKRCIQDALNWYREVLKYNVPHGKKNRGMSVVQTFKTIAPAHMQTDDMIHKSRILGWCVEILQAYLLIADDVMDQSETRRGQACWYKKPNVGLIAINDAFYLENCIFWLLKRYFRGMDCYVYLIEAFTETNFRTIVGQSLDILSSLPDEKYVGKFTMERYSTIVKYKTAYYSFCLPVTLALHLAGVHDEKTHQASEQILLKMGHFFQVQDDYLDCFGDPEITGKVGTDIQDQKCSWLIVQALQYVTEQQKREILKNYGKSDPEAIERVKMIYRDLNLPDMYKKYEDSSYAELQQSIESFSRPDLPKSIFYCMAQKIYKRQK